MESIPPSSLSSVAVSPTTQRAPRRWMECWYSLAGAMCTSSSMRSPHARLHAQPSGVAASLWVARFGPTMLYVVSRTIPLPPWRLYVCPVSSMKPGSLSLYAEVRRTMRNGAMLVKLKSDFRHCSTEPRWGHTITTDWPILHATAIPVSVLPAPHGKTINPPCTAPPRTVHEMAFSW